ncbi:MAG: acyl-CoA dehydrogenase domain protein, partial [Myxococcales bacterium]|nr:acyl-CoA dehydrogenase domain protein [Myxococcales bacterium]
MLDFTDEQKMARKMLRQWADKELAPHVAKMEKGEILPYDIMRKLISAFGMDEMVRAQFKKLEEAGDQGPEKSGGNKERAMADPGLMAVVSMELSRVCPGFCLAFGASLGLAGGAIMAKGTLAQKQKWALPILTMQKIGAWGMTEPGAGSDAFGSMRTTARRDGDSFVLNGQKTFITNAPYADTFVIYAKLEGNEDSRYRPFHAFIIDKATPGLSVSKPMDKMGMHSSPTGEIFLADVRVPADQLLGGRMEEHSREQARDVFHGERTGMATMCLGIIERCLEDSLAYAQQRETWGKKIAEYQLIQEKIAR